ncbi:MAG: hypothetical protein SVV67_03445 [Bacillota bacterium]|nr:hypothetical protein [Bacillota bacterium]
MSDIFSSIITVVIDEGRIALFYYFPNLKLININLDIAVEAARTRDSYNFATPDSILLASALHAGADAFYYL